MPKNKLIIYGAVAKIPTSSKRWEKSKNFFHQILDRIKIKTKKNHKIDYRNYISSTTYNRGDHAIIQASNQIIKQKASHLEINPVNWGDIDKPSNSQVPFAICGSGYFFLNNVLQFPSRLHNDLASIKGGNSLAMIYGAGVNLLDPTLKHREINPPKDQLNFLSDFLEHCEHISVRDAASQRLLQCCTSRQVHLIGDPAFLIEPYFDIKPEKIFSKEIIHIGVNIPFHGPGACSRINEDFPAYITALNKIQKKTDCLFHYIIHYDSEILIAKLIQDAGIKINIIHGDVDALLHAYQQLNMHIGGMLHSCILASSRGTPAIGLAYDIKHSGFFDLLKLPEHCIPAQPFDPDHIVNLSMQILKNENQLRLKILKRRMELKDKADEFLQSALQRFD